MHSSVGWHPAIILNFPFSDTKGEGKPPEASRYIKPVRAHMGEGMSESELSYPSRVGIKCRTTVLRHTKMPASFLAVLDMVTHACEP